MKVFSGLLQGSNEMVAVKEVHTGTGPMASIDLQEEIRTIRYKECLFYFLVVRAGRTEMELGSTACTADSWGAILCNKVDLINLLRLLSLIFLNWQASTTPKHHQIHRLPTDDWRVSLDYGGCPWR